MRHGSVIGRTEQIEEGFDTVRMEIKKLLIRWAMLTLKFITINLILGTLGDYVLFGPLQESLHQYFGLNDYDGYGDTEDPTRVAVGDGEGDVDAGEEYVMD